MPAVTLKHSTTHSSQNCGVLIALRAETSLSLISEPTGCAVGSRPAGFQSSAGTRMSSRPTDLNTAYPMPSVNGIALATPEMPSDVSSGFLNTLHA